MNGVTSVGVNTQNYQTAFKAKGSKAAHEVIDQAHDMAKEITRPVAEKKENMIRRYVSKFIEVLGRINIVKMTMLSKTTYRFNANYLSNYQWSFLQT